jgi:hypothetical protein
VAPGRGPIGPARLGCELALRALPEPDDRLRYRAEFTADLTCLGPAAQLRYAAGVLSQTFALRAALGTTPARAEEDAMTLPTRRRPFSIRCSLLRWHAWARRSTEDGGRYLACRRCGRERSTGSSHPLAGMDGGAM